MASIAHGYGNRRERIATALALGVDYIEADLRFDRGGIWIRHERKLPFVPILFNGPAEQFHRSGPWAIDLCYLSVRLDMAPISFSELLETVGTRAGLLLDMKADRYSLDTAARFVTLVDTQLRTRHTGRIRYCGSWPLLDLVAQHHPGVHAHYSVDRPADWQRLLSRLEHGSPIGGASVRAEALDEHRAELLASAGIEYYCWDVSTVQEADRAAALGAAGIISHHLDVLSHLSATGGNARHD